MKNYNVFKLNNGIRVVLLPLVGLKSVTTEVFLKIGSKYEKKGEYGLSHFLEHMAFKGTKRRPSASVINSEIDSKGASYNAGTGHELTSYYITTVKENSAWAFDMLSDILINSSYDTKESEKERGVIIEEIKMYQDNPIMGLSSEFSKFIYGKSNIGCWNISGEVKDIEKVTRKDYVDFRNKYFNPKEIVVVVCGDIDNSVKKKIVENFEKIKPNNIELPKVSLVVNKEKNKRIRKELEQGHFCMGLPTVASSDKRKYALKLLDIIFDGNSSSRLYSKIREERALAYYVSPIGEMFQEGGYWGIQSGVGLNKIDEAMDIVRNEIKRLAGTITQEEVSRAKDYLIGRIKLAMDRTSFVSSFIGQELLLSKSSETIENDLKKYMMVTCNEVNDLAKELFKEDQIRILVCKNK